MAGALLLNSLAMTFASIRFYKKKLIVFEIAVPMMIMGSISGAICAFISNYINRDPLLWMFAAFCVIAGAMMLFFTPKERKSEYTRQQYIKIGVVMGFFAGIGGGLLGVGGGNLLVAVLVWLGLEPKKSIATTAFIVIFISFAGFLGHMKTGLPEMNLMLATATCAVAGAMLGAWLMTEKISAANVKRIVGGVLVLIAIKVIWDLI